MQAIRLPDASRIGSRDPHRGWCNTLQRETKHDGALLILRGSVCAFKKGFAMTYARRQFQTATSDRLDCNTLQ